MAVPAGATCAFDMRGGEGVGSRVRPGPSPVRALALSPVYALQQQLYTTAVLQLLLL